MPRPKKKTLVSFQHAWDGIWHVIRTERHVQVQAVVALLIVGAGAWVRLTREQWFMVLIALTLVFLAEMINTALSACVELYQEKYAPVTGKACQVAAGARLFALALAAVMIAVVFLRPPL